VLASIPLVGAWAASKWMIPWADKLATATHPGYKAVVQGWWALGATLGSFVGAQVAAWLGRRRAYFLIALGTTALTVSMFQLTAPLRPSFLPVVFAQGFRGDLVLRLAGALSAGIVSTRVRATGAGLAMNTRPLCHRRGRPYRRPAVHGLGRELTPSSARSPRSFTPWA